MASNQTANYGLSQWAPEDNFSREDFNGDHGKIDAALKRIQDSGDTGVAALRQEVQGSVQTLTQGTQAVKEQLIPVTYNVYQLMLQNYYDGKVTGGKKALMFDGFLDEGGISSKSAVYVCNRALGLYRSGEAAQTVAAGGSHLFINDSPSTPVYTAINPGRLTGVAVTYREDSANYSQVGYLILKINGLEVQRMTFTLTSGASTNSAVARQLLLTTPVIVLPGDTYQLTVSGANRQFAFSANASRTHLAGQTLISSLGATSGSVTAKAVAGMPAYEKALLYLRYTGGTTTPTLNGAGMTRLSTRQTVNLQNQPCTEECWSAGAGSGSTTVGLRLSVGSAVSCLVHDYGLVLL